MSKPEKPKSKAGSWIKPGFVLAAVTLAWAAGNTPPDFSATSTAIWAAGTLTIALITKAAMTIIEPIVKQTYHALRQQISSTSRAQKQP